VGTDKQSPNLVEEIRDRINVGEDQIASQDLDSPLELAWPVLQKRIGLRLSSCLTVVQNISSLRYCGS